MSECKQCGDCCRYVVLPIVADDEGYYEWLRLHGARIVNQPVAGGVTFVCARFELPCSALVDGKCSIYDRRPEMCRRWECEKP